MNARTAVRTAAVALASIVGMGAFSGLEAAPKPKGGDFTSKFYLQDCQWQSEGANP